MHRSTIVSGLVALLALLLALGCGTVGSSFSLLPTDEGPTNGATDSSVDAGSLDGTQALGADAITDTTQTPGLEANPDAARDGAPDAGSVDTGPPETGGPLFTIGGTISGLSLGASIIVQDNGGNDLTATNGPFVLSPPQATGAMYTVTVLTQPADACTVTNGSGTVGTSNVTGIVITCTTTTFTVGGTVNGLVAGDTLVLENNGGDPLTLTTSGPFTFATPIPNGNGYAATVLDQPTDGGLTCSVVAGSGTVNGASVTSVVVNCSASAFTIGGTLSGLAAGGTVAIQNNGGNTLFLTTNGLFAFMIPLASGSGYAVTVSANPAQPTPQTCIVAAGSGTVSNANVTDVAITCTTVDAGGGNSLDNGLVAYWNLNGNAMDSMAGGSNLGPAPSGGTVTYTAGKMGQGLFPGICSVNFLCANAVSLQSANSNSAPLLFNTPSDDFTVSLWALRTPSMFADNTWWGYALMENGQISIAAQGMGAGAAPVYPQLVLANNGTVIGTVQDNAFNFRAAANTNVWVHIIAFRRGTTIGIRVNGNETTAAVGGSVGSPGTFSVGVRSSGYPWQGRMDEVGKWNRALSPGEMDTLYNSGAGVALP